MHCQKYLFLFILMSFFCFRRWQKWILMGIMRRIILNKYFVVLWTCFQMMIRNFPRQDTSLTLVPPSPSLGHITTAYADYWVLAFIISLITLQISRSSYWFYLRSLFGEERVETKLNFHLSVLLQTITEVNKNATGVVGLGFIRLGLLGSFT